MAEEKKGFFKKLGDKLSNRDEIEAAEKAAELAKSKAKAEAARLARAKDAAKKEATKVKAEAEAKVKAAAEAKAEEAKKNLAKLRQKKMAKETADKVAKRKADREAKKAEEAAKVVKHVWTNEDTYSSLAFTHYGSIKKPYWWLIYEHNKDIIGDNPNSIKTGTEIEIPPLPAELKDK